MGQAIDLNGTPVTVIGVMPDGFDFGSIFSPGYKVDMYGPVIYDDIRDEGNTMALVGRLSPGVSLAQAQAEADLVFPTLLFSLKHPEYGTGYTGNLLGLKDYVSGKLRRSLIVLWCAVGLILLIVCVNLSNLLLARAAARSKEFAMRTALGATRGRLVRQLLTESLILSFAGALFGLAIAFSITAYLAHQGSIALPLLSKRGESMEPYARLDCTVGEARIRGGGFVWSCSRPQDLQRQFAGVAQRLGPWVQRRQEA